MRASWWRLGLVGLLLTVGLAQNQGNRELELSFLRAVLPSPNYLEHWLSLSKPYQGIAQKQRRVGVEANTPLLTPYALNVLPLKNQDR